MSRWQVWRTPRGDFRAVDADQPVAIPKRSTFQCDAVDEDSAKNACMVLKEDESRGRIRAASLRIGTGRCAHDAGGIG